MAYKEDIDDVWAMTRRRNYLREKVEMLQAYNRNTRVGQLWINGDAIELTREDYEEIKDVLIAKMNREIGFLSEEISRAARFLE